MSPTRLIIVSVGIAFLCVLGLVAALLLVCVGRTLTIQELDNGDDLFMGVEYAFDEGQMQRFTKVFGESLKFKTISIAPGEYDKDELLKLQNFLRKSFPLVFNTSFITVETVNTYSLLLTIQGSNLDLKPYMLTSHLDVVPVDPKQWSRDPFLGEVVADPITGEDVIWGRGAIDDKVGVVAILSALELLLISGWVASRSFFVGFGHDEEVSGKDGAGHIGKLLRDRGVSLDFLLDEGMPILQGVFAGIDPPIATIGVTEKGHMNVRVSVVGEGGHSSVPHREQAVYMLAAALQGLNRNPQPSMFGLGPEEDMLRYLAPKAEWPYKLLFANTWLFGPLLSYVMSQKRESNALIRTTTAVTIVKAGVKDNVVPGSAWALVNHRVHPAQTLDEVLAHDIAAIGNEKVKVEMLGGVGPHPVSPYGPESLPYMLIAGAVKHVYPEVVVVPGTMVANTDTKHYLNLTKNIYRLLPFILTSSQVPSIHGKDENLSSRNFISTTNFFETVILAADANKNDTVIKTDVVEDASLNSTPESDVFGTEEFADN